MGTSYSTNNERKYGWKKEIPDHNDLYHEFDEEMLNENMNTVDLRKNCPVIYNQGNLGSCTANAVAGLFEYNQDKENKIDFMPSRLFIYYNERELENTTMYDSGATIRDSIKVVYKYGVCSEDKWTYSFDKFTYKPSPECYEEASKHKIVEYRKIYQTIEDMKTSLQNKMPFIFGFSVYESFEGVNVARTGIMPIPSVTEKLLGGHAVMAVGYNEDLKVFIVRNSWGENWGDKGYFYMPYEFISDPMYASDFWTILKV